MNPIEEKQRAEERKRLFLQYKAELEQNEWLKTYLEQAYPSSRQSFIDSYAQEKVSWMEWGETVKEWNENEDMSYLSDATERLEEILQKKLFDLQCQWRAEKITLEGVVASVDFEYYEKDIFNCPFLPPITENELNLYIQYLQTENFEFEQGIFDSWQDYYELKEAYNDGNASRNFPDWYDFHNGRTGASVNMLLPNIRGDKEEFYLDLWREEERQKVEEITKNPPPPDPQTDTRPFLNYHAKGWMEWFVKTFEDKETQEKFEKYDWKHYSDSDFDEEEIDDAVRNLSLAEEDIPMQGWYDWREALLKIYHTYRKKKIAETLPAAYEQYKMTVELGLGFESKDPDPWLRDYMHNAILRGRELNGEPRNFDF